MQPSSGDIAVQHRQPAILAEGVRGVADHARCAIDVERVVALALAERDQWSARRRARRDRSLRTAFAVGAGDVPAVQRIGQRRGMNGGTVAYEAARRGPARPESP